MNEIVCKLSDEERTEIQDLFEKKLAFENLLKIVDPNQNEALYQRLLTDYGKTSVDFQGWWDRMFKKHSLPQGNYSVDFDAPAIVKSGVEK